MKRLTAALAGHPRHVLAASLAAGIALATTADTAVTLLAVAVAIACFATRLHPAVAMTACALLIAGAALGDLRIAAIDADPLAARQSAHQLTLRGYLLEHPRTKQYGTTMRARMQVGEGRWQTIEIRSYEPLRGDARIGHEIAASGSVSAVDAAAGRSPEAASYARYLIRNGVLRRMQAKEIALTGRRRGGVKGAIDAIRTRSERTLATGLDAEPAALLRGMVLGGDNGIPESTTEDFRAAGLSHILAVSGQNVLLIVILVQAIAVALDLPWRWRIIIPVALVCIYVPLCGAQASVLRAGAMGLAGLAAVAASRPGSRIYALLLAAIFVLAWNPRATADVGAQLSFAAVLGIMAFTQPLAARLRRLPRWAAEAFAATAGATIATAPLMAFHFGAVSLVSLAANVIAAPLIGPIVWLGSLAAAIGQFAPAIGSLLNAPNGFLLGALIELAHGAAAVPLAQVAVPDFSVPALALLALPVIGAAAWLNGWIEAPPRIARAIELSLEKGRAELAAVGSMPLAAFVTIVIAALALAGWPERAVPRRPAIAFLDIGQGDATLLMGAGDCNALIDGGPPGARLEAELRRLGVKQLDLVLITHAQLDHFGGIAELANAGFAVAQFLDGGGAQQVPEYNELRANLASEGTKMTPAVSGTRWRCGELAISVLAPATADARRIVSDPNTLATVADISVGPMRLLAAGDAESPQLLPLPLPNVDLLKVSHHGSADPGLPGVLARADPEVAVIEVGKENRYGHPDERTLQALGVNGAAIFRTDRDGTVTVNIDDAGALVVSRRRG